MSGSLGRFELGERLGSGAFGEVHAARDRGERLALKRLKHVSPDALARFKREFRALRDLVHPNLIALHELGCVDDAWFYTMELIDGVDVTRWLGGGVGARATLASGDDERAVAAASAALMVAPARLAAVLRQLADALDAVHGAGRLHCDLKPNNILVDRDGRLRVCDFGLVADVGDRSAHGTAWFMAPEQVAGEPLGPAADWYAIGVILFELIAGRPPFVGTADEVRAAKQRQPAPPLATIAAGTPSAIAALVDGLLAATPAARAGAAEVRAVAALLDGAPRGDEASLVVREAPLVGRADALAALDAAADAARSRAVVVRVLGASGIGKSALCRTWLAAQPATTWVLHGRCYDREHMPFRAIDPAIDALVARLDALTPAARAELIGSDVGALARLFPVVRHLDGGSDDAPPEDARQRGFAAARRLFARLAAAHRVVIWLDDLQWSDDGSGALLAELLRGADAPPILCLASCRSEDAGTSPVLAALARTDVAMRELTLPALDERAGAAMARALGRDRDAAAIAREAGGSPFLVRELALASSATRPGALSVDQVVRARVASLPPPCQALLAAVALARGPLARTLALRAAPDADAAAITALRHAGLVRTATARDDDDVLDTYHDRVREAVIDGLAAPARRALHARLADALLAAAAPELERVAWHQRDAGDRPAAHATARAAAAAAATPERAAALYALAAELAVDDRDRRAARVARAEALVTAGHGHTAAAAFADATDGATDDDALVLRRRAAEMLLRGGYLDAGRAAAAAVLAAHGVRWPGTPRAVVASLLVQRARLAVTSGPRTPRALDARGRERIDALWGLAGALSMTDHLRGAELQARNLRAAIHAGEPVRLSRSLALEAIYSATAGGRGRARSRRLIAQARALATNDPLAAGVVELAVGVCAQQAGEWLAARDGCATAIAALEPIPGAFFELANAQLFWLESLVYLGELDALAEAVPRLLDDAVRRGDAYSIVFLRGGPPSFRWIHAGEPARVLADTRAVAATLPRGVFHVPHLLLMLAELQAHLACDDGAAAWAVVERDWPALDRSLLLRAQNVLIEMTSLRGRAALASGRPALARAAAARIRKERMPWGDALAALLDAALVDDPPAWRTAAAACTACTMPLHAAAALTRAGDPAPRALGAPALATLAPRLRRTRS